MLHKVAFQLTLCLQLSFVHSFPFGGRHLKRCLLGLIDCSEENKDWSHSPQKQLHHFLLELLTHMGFHLYPLP